MVYGSLVKRRILSTPLRPLYREYLNIWFRVENTRLRNTAVLGAEVHANGLMHIHQRRPDSKSSYSSGAKASRRGKVSGRGILWILTETRFESTNL